VNFITPRPVGSRFRKEKTGGGTISKKIRKRENVWLKGEQGKWGKYWSRREKTARGGGPGRGNDIGIRKGNKCSGPGANEKKKGKEKVGWRPTWGVREGGNLGNPKKEDSEERRELANIFLYRRGRDKFSAIK